MECSLSYEGIPLKIALETDPELPEIDLVTPGERSVADFELEVETSRPDPDSQLVTWRLRRRDGAPFQVSGFSVNAAVPGIDLHRMFVPVLHDAIGKLDLISLPWGITERSFISWSFPLIAALNRVDTNRFCMGFMDHITSVEATEQSYDEDIKMGLRRLWAEEPRPVTEWEETLYLSIAPRHIFDEVRAFSRAYDQVNQPALCHTPPSAWEPVWCTWYGIKNNITADYILEMAPHLTEMGFRTIIVDAGWWIDGHFDEQTGHFRADEDKFPDLRGMVETLQAQGLRVMLWCNPLFHVQHILEQPLIKEHLIEREESTPGPFLCPRCRPVREYVGRMVGHLMRTYGIDGLKIDFIDAHGDKFSRGCTAGHAHDFPTYGEGMQALLQTIHDAVKAVRSDALLEFRNNYATPTTRRFATNHRAQDAPLDFDHIRRMCTRLRSFMIYPEAGMEGNVSVHTDPAWWQPEESAENVGRFMSSLVTSGVPMLSTDLRSLQGEHRRIVKAWLAFFLQHQELLLVGTHRVLGNDPHHSLFSLHRGEEAVLGVFTPHFPGELQTPASDIRRMWILNGTGQGHVFARLAGLEGARLAVETRDRGLESRTTAVLPIEDGRVILDVDVEAGGALELRVEE